MSKSGLEDFGGEPLDRLSSGPLPPERFLPIAIAIAQALDAVHAHNVIHKDIKPENILVHPHTGEVKLTGFGIASRLPVEHQAVQNPSLIEGTLAYMSPEQSGRMNRSVDDRTDLYSLGVPFYQLLTGTLPFSAHDPLGEVQVLLDTFARVVAHGAPALMLVAGYSGIGKSSLVHELHRPIVAARGLFGTGKFDQYQRGIPTPPSPRPFAISCARSSPSPRPRSPAGASASPRFSARTPASSPTSSPRSS